MSTQPEALFLANALTAQPDCICHTACYIECACDAIWPEQWVGHAAAELRRQFGEIESMRAERVHTERRLAKAEAQRDALLEALRAFVKQYGSQDVQAWMRVRDEAIAAIKAVEEGK